MTASAIEILYNSYRNAKQFSPEYSIDFFETNPVNLSSFKSFNVKEDVKIYTELIWQYINALYLKNRYNETIDKAISYFSVVEKEIEKFDDETLKDRWYYGILFFKGMASYNLGDYKTATPIFKSLTVQDPKNENYKRFLSYSLYGQRMWISKTIVVICGLLLLIEIFFKQLITSIARLILDGIAFTALVGTMIYDYYIKRNRRKSKRI
jgi:tetratricopeptide (TPR) repeat protein